MNMPEVVFQGATGGGDLIRIVRDDGGRLAVERSAVMDAMGCPRWDPCNDSGGKSALKQYATKVDTVEGLRAIVAAL